MIKLIALFAFIFMGYIGNAFALSCMPFDINKENIEKTNLIFEGTVIGSQAVVENDNKNLNRFASYEFEINKIWKSDFENGVIDTNNFTIKRNIYWGDDFQLNKTYLIFADKNKSGEFISPLCGLAIVEEHAEDTKEKLNTILNKKEEDNE